MGCRNTKPILRPRSAAFLVTVLIAGCNSGSTPEDEIRALVGAAETAAEERDAAALKGLVADDYQDNSGRTAADLRAYLHGWLLAHPSVHLITRIDSIELEGTELARAQVTVGMLGRETAGESWELAGDIWRLDVRLARESDAWRVIRAGLQDGG